MFEVGQQVVCVDDAQRPGHVWGPNCAPLKGARYTVTELLAFEDGEGLRFSEISNHFHPHQSYAARRFRPVTRTRDTISYESFMTIRPGFEEPRRVETNEPKKEEVR